MDGDGDGVRMRIVGVERMERAVERAVSIEGGRKGPVGVRAAASVLLTLVAAGCGGDAAATDGAEPNGRAGAEAAAGGARVVNVRTEVVRARDFEDVIRMTGTVEANRDVVVSAEEAGPIREIFVEKGARVGEDQPIARIDDRVLRSQVDEAEARAGIARETWERRRRLYEEDRVGSELAYLEAKYEAERAAAAAKILSERLARTVVRAPFAGILDDVPIDVGSMVGVGSPVARIVDLDPVKVTAGVPERYASDVRPGARARVTFAVLDDRTFDGAVHYVGAAIDPGSRTFPVELTLPNPGRDIKPEMVADVRLTRRVVEDALVVPREALVRVEDGSVVFVVAEGAAGPVAEARRVEIGPSRENRVVVTDGLAVGDEVVVVGQRIVADGDRVRVVGGEEPGG